MNGTIIGIIVALILGVSLMWFGFKYLLRPLLSKYKTNTTTTGNTQPTTRNSSMSTGWIKPTLMITLIVGLIGGLIWTNLKLRNERERSEEIASRKVVVIETTKYDWYCRLTSGSFCGGRTESAPDERTLERVDEDNPKVLNFNLYYKAYGKREEMRIRMFRVSPTRWEGTWEQSDCSGRVSVDLVGKSGYAGEITCDQTGARGVCQITKN